MPKKVFELAKELDMGAIDLVEELKAMGYPVKNHMNSISDDEVSQFLEQRKEALKAGSVTKKKKKKKKAKVAKASSSEGKKEVGSKKVLKKVVAAKTSAAGDSASASADGDAAGKSRRTVVRKRVALKTDDNEIELAAEKSVEHSLEIPEVALETSDEQEVEHTRPSEDENSSGLRVVSRPAKIVREKPKKQAVLQTSAEAPESASVDDEVEGSKAHRFTPVYIPPKAAADDDDSSDESKSSSSDDDDEDGDKKNKSKKRIGGLASIMSGKKSTVNKAQVIIQTRADTELKSYGALSGVGRPLYTQIMRKRAYSGPMKNTELTAVKEAKRIVKLHGGALAEELAKKLSVKLKDMVDQCLDMNLLIKAGDYIGLQLASEIAALYDYRVEDVAFDEDKMIGKEEMSEDKMAALPLRNPIIAIMGHVDHGKTTLLDSIRKAKVAAGEAGGITQHIGAYSVEVKNQTLTFLDTPGHAAFASMRQRGADVTDIVILVVAADDGVMPQTRESIRFCQEAKKMIIVAVNKMDKEGVNPDRIKQELTEFHITPEEWGGDTLFCPISALKGEGIDALLESIALTAEMMELRSEPTGPAQGVVIESKIEQGRGPVATILIQSGTLNKGDSIVVGESFGRARSIIDSLGNELQSAGPSMPVQILGLSETPAPGDILNTVKNERESKKIAENRVQERKNLEQVNVKRPTMSLEDFFSLAATGSDNQKELKLVIRADVQGSYQAICQSLEALSNNEVRVKIIAGGVGPISDSDVTLAAGSGAYVIGFNMRPVNSARRLAEHRGIEVRTYSVIYELIDEVTAAIEGLLDPDLVEEFIGRAEVRDTFLVPKIGMIAGSYVIDGKIQVGCQIRLLRDGKIIFDGKMSSLKRFKDDVKEVKNGFECGVGLENFKDVKSGDVFEAYIMTKKKRTLADVAKAEAAAAAEAAVAAELAAAKAAAEASANDEVTG